MQSSFTRLLVVLAALVIVAIGLRLAADFLAPIILGGFVVVLCIPIVEAFQRRGWPHWTAVLVSALLYVAAVALLAVIGLISLRELVELVPELTSGAEGTESEAEGILAPIIGAEAAAAVATALRLAQFLPFIQDVAVAMIQAAILLGLGGLIMIYGLIGAKNMPGVALHAFGEKRGAQEGWNRFSRGMRSFFGARAVLGAVMATGAGIWLAVLGQELVLFWSFVAFLFSFVPNIGLILSMIGPAFIALLTDGWQTALLIVAGYGAINVVVDYVIQPRLMARELNLSPLVVFLSLLLWAALLGPIGALLAIPITLGIQILLAGFDDSRWFATLLSNTPPEGLEPASAPAAPTTPDTTTTE
jgi:predicted PurR-regulated permease PerM